MKVYKYSIPINDYFNLDLPIGARILSVQTQGKQPQMWVLVNPEEPTEKRLFRLIGTGHYSEELPDELTFIDTFQLYGGALIFHVFEVTK